MPLIADQSAAAVQGIVTNDSGKAIPGIRVQAMPVDPKGAIVWGVTDKDGAFSLANVAAGTYSICVQDVGAQYLDPCRWSTPTTVTVAAGKALSNVSISVNTGATLQIRVDDPKALADVRGANNEVVAVVIQAGSVLPMFVVSNDASGKTFQVAVPDGTHQVALLSKQLKFADQTGAALGISPDVHGHIGDPHIEVVVPKGVKNVSASVSIAERSNN